MNDAPRIATPLVRWYRKHRRDLPWRRNRDPYAVWISEIMLQQTTVATAIPYYERFLAAFPTLSDLASAPLDEVLKLWSGLGYYRRARLLHRAAQVIQESHDGTFPDDLKEALALPGVGRYTAGAVLSIAYQRAVPLVDGNVARVFSRLMAIDSPIEALATQKKLWSLAEATVSKSSPGDFNQGLMELGATVCTPTSPRCQECPLAKQCQALEHGRVHELPRKKQRPKTKKVTLAIVVAVWRKRFVLIQRSKDQILAGLWEPPSIEPKPKATCDDHRRVLREDLGLEAASLHPIGKAKHAIMQTRYDIQVFEAPLQRKPQSKTSGRDIALVEESSLGDYALTGMGRKALDLMVQVRREGTLFD